MIKTQIFLIFLFCTFFIFGQNEIKIINNKDIKITKLDQLNSSYRETNLNISPDGKYLYFMSDRGGQPWSTFSGTFNGSSRYDGDIWFSKKINGKWQNPHCLSNKINTWSGEDEPNISPDGQRVYYQSWKSYWQTTGGPYYTAVLTEEQWSSSTGLGGGITDFFVGEYNKSYYYATDGMCISPDGKTFIVAAGADYDGNLDLYLAHNKRGVWEKPSKMNICTDKDERSIFIAGDGRTIFFASDGYGGFGGLDIFIGTLQDDGKCVNVRNIGKPFNTSKDDYGFIVTASGEEAYFVREGDIYFAELPPENELSPKPTVLVKGRLIDCNYKPIETEIVVLDKEENKIADSKTSSKGEYLFILPNETEKYTIFDKNNNKLKVFDVTKSDDYQEIKFNIKDCNSGSATSNGAKSAAGMN